MVHSESAGRILIWILIIPALYLNYLIKCENNTFAERLQGSIGLSGLIASEEYGENLYYSTGMAFTLAGCVAMTFALTGLHTCI